MKPSLFAWALVCSTITFAQVDTPVALSTAAVNGTNITSTLTNNSSLSITATLIGLTFYDHGHRRLVAHRYLDSAVNLTDTAIAPGEHRSVILSSAKMASQFTYEVALEAVVFSDGTTFGAQESINIITQRRQLILNAIHHYRSMVTSTWNEGGRTAALLEVSSTHASEKQAALAQHVPLPLATANEQVAQFVIPAIGGANDVCDEACSEYRLSYIMNGLQRWEDRMSATIQKTSTSK